MGPEQPPAPFPRAAGRRPPPAGTGAGAAAGPGIGIACPPSGAGTSIGPCEGAVPPGTGSPGSGVSPGSWAPGTPGSCGAACGRCWPPTVVEPSGRAQQRLRPGRAGGAECRARRAPGPGPPAGAPAVAGAAAAPGSGSLAVQRRWRDAVGRFGCADHHPVAARVLDQVGGVPRRDHALLAGRLGQRRRGLRLAHIAFERFLLLQQRPRPLPGVAQVVGPLGRVGGQPQREAQAQRQRADHQHHERNLARRSCSGPQVDGRQPGGQTLGQPGPDDLGRLGLPRLGPRLGLARALGPGGPLDRPGDRAGLRPGLRRPGAPERGAVAVTPRARVRRDAVSTVPWPPLRAALLRPPGGRRCGVSAPRAWPSCVAPPGCPLITSRSTRSRARNRTEALRGLRSISAASARSAPRVSDRNRGSWPGSSTGRPGGVREATASANTRLTIRSSSD